MHGFDGWSGLSQTQQHSTAAFVLVCFGLFGFRFIYNCGREESRHVFPQAYTVVVVAVRRCGGVGEEGGRRAYGKRGGVAGGPNPT